MYTFVEQKHIKDLFLKERIELIGSILKEEDIDAWLILSKEYNEDVVFPFLVPADYYHARRITALLFTHKDGVTDAISMSLPDENLEKYYHREYDFKTEDLYEALTRELDKINPNKIALNYSQNFAFADGLSTGLYKELCEKLPERLTSKFVSSENVAIRVLETRTASELKYYPEVMKVAMDVIDEAYSDKVITPGKTTLRDVMDFMDSKVNSLGISCWFESTVNLQNEKGFFEEDTVIQKGDLLHCDFGITYLHLNTDTQRLCYILKDDEDELPESLKTAMKNNNRFQDIVRSCYKVGKTGNDVFLEALEKGKAEGLRPVLYTHPLGLHGHAAGPIIGLYTNQNPIPVRGDLKLHDSTGYALELTTIEYVEHYGCDIRMMTEESVVYKDGEVYFLAENRDKIKAIKGNI
ncbi:MAG: M24 family metallopeptidase [Erysipelotrichaceae bacterium]|nr:M24 family metallopeptidase [Erysipelotrichaceae bacterium]